MRTSMNLPDDLLDRARDRARAEHRTVTSLVEEALRQLLDGQRRPPLEPLPTDGMPDGKLLIDLDDNQAMYAYFDEHDLRDFRGPGWTE